MFSTKNIIVVCSSSNNRQNNHICRKHKSVPLMTNLKPKCVTIITRGLPDTAVDDLVYIGRI